MTLNHLLFVLMSLIWGMTWLATKVALAAVPPVFFGAARYVLVSAVLLVAVRGVFSVFSRRPARVVLSGVLVNVGTYALLYWGMQFVASGVAGVVNMSMNPVFLFAFAILLGQERAGLRHLLALVLGIAGLVILFSSKASFGGTAIEIWAAAAFVGASISYSLGSVLSRPLLDQVTPIQLTAAQGLVAAIGLSLLSLALEPVSPATFRALLTPLPLAGLLFMVFFGTFVAYTIYLQTGARLGRAARRPVFVRVAGGGADPRRDRAGRAAHLARGRRGGDHAGGSGDRRDAAQGGTQVPAMKRYDAVVFDLLTALINSWTLWNAAAGSPDDGLRWRRKYLELTYQQGAYRPYEAIVRAAAEQSGVGAHCADELERRWDELPPWPETIEVLGALARRLPLGVATNCSIALGRRAAARCGVAFAAVVTAEEAGFYKPRPEPYRAVLAQLGTAPARTLVRGGLGRRRAGRQGRRHAGLLAQSHGAAGARWRHAGFHGNLAAAAAGARVMPSTGTKLLARARDAAPRARSRPPRAQLRRDARTLRHARRRAARTSEDREIRRCRAHRDQCARASRSRR